MPIMAAWRPRLSETHDHRLTLVWQTVGEPVLFRVGRSVHAHAAEQLLRILQSGDVLKTKHRTFAGKEFAG